MNISKLIEKLNSDNKAIEAGIVHGNDKYNVLIKDITEIYNLVISKMTESYNRAEATEKVLSIQCEAAEVTFDEIKDGIRIMLPRNLPKKKAFTDKYDIALFRNSYMKAFGEYFSEQPKHFKEKVLIHIHSVFLKKSEMLDYDNMAIKQILDIIALFMLVDDNPTRYDLYMSASVGNERQTIITISESWKGGMAARDSAS